MWADTVYANKLNANQYVNLLELISDVFSLNISENATSDLFSKFLFCGSRKKHEYEIILK